MLVKRLLVAVVCSFSGIVVVMAQSYPNKPIRLVTATIGAGADTIARIMTPDITSALGQPFVIDNKPQAVIPEIVAKAPGDGYTILVSSNAAWNTSLVRKISYDAVKDLAAVTQIARYTSIVTVHPSLGINSVKDLIAQARAKPGALNASTGSTGGAGHLALELFKSAAGVNITRVPYSSGSQEIADLLAARVQMTLGTGPEMAPHLKSGKMKGLAVTSAQPSLLFPDLPTVAASGVPGYVFESSYNVFVPAGTPTAVINRLNQEVARSINKPNIKQLIADAGAEVIGGTPEAMAAVREAELSRLGKVLREAGVTAQ